MRVEFPADQFRYSGGGYAILQKIISDINQKTIQEAIDQLVFDPLKIRQASFEPIPATDMSVAQGYHWDPETQLS